MIGVAQLERERARGADPLPPALEYVQCALRLAALAPDPRQLPVRRLQPRGSRQPALPGALDVRGPVQRRIRPQHHLVADGGDGVAREQPLHVGHERIQLALHQVEPLQPEQCGKRRRAAAEHTLKHLLRSGVVPARLEGRRIADAGELVAQALHGAGLRLDGRRRQRGCAGEQESEETAWSHLSVRSAVQVG